MVEAYNWIDNISLSSVFILFPQCGLQWYRSVVYWLPQQSLHFTAVLFTVRKLRNWRGSVVNTARVSREYFRYCSQHCGTCKGCSPAGVPQDCLQYPMVLQMFTNMIFREALTSNHWNNIRIIYVDPESHRNWYHKWF